MKKKILIISLAVAVLAIAVIGGTLAWFTDTESATNAFVVGDVSIQLREPTWNGLGFGDVWADLQWDDTGITTEMGVYQAHNLVPGRVIPKNPQIMNNGTNECYVRLVLTSTDITTADGWNAFIAIMQGQNDTNWTWEVAADGSAVYAYYNSVLNPLGTTGAAFTGFQFAPDATEANVADIAGADGQFDLVVTAQAIQAEGFTLPASPAIDDFNAIFGEKTFVANA